MRIVVEYDVPEDDDMYAMVNTFDTEGDWPGLLEVAACCSEYSVHVER